MSRGAADSSSFAVISHNVHVLHREARLIMHDSTWKIGTAASSAIIMSPASWSRRKAFLEKTQDTTTTYAVALDPLQDTAGASSAPLFHLLLTLGLTWGLFPSLQP